MFFINTLRKLPRASIILFLIITTFLLSFLLLGCSKTSSTYSSVYLISYKYNSSSSFYSLIESAYNKKNLTGYEDMEVRANYLSICVIINDDETCTSRGDLSQYTGLTKVNIYSQTSNSSTSLDLVNLASDFSNEVVHPYVLITTLILTLTLMLCIFYLIVPGLPKKSLINKFNLVLSLTLVLLWGLGAMWSHVAANSGQLLVENSSMGIIAASVGKRAAAMTWAAFAFLTIVGISVISMYLKELHAQIEDVKV